jgi:GNAT superfamily N-acetyltransferase
LLTFPWRIYRDDPLWVPPLLPEREKVIDPQRGPFFQRGGEAELFIAWQDGRPVGTICAADDVEINTLQHRRECLFGFFECIEDYAVAEAMLNRACEWARARGLDTLFGPFNLDRENGYGLLIEGRDRPPALMCGHTPPYYPDLLLRIGFQPGRGDNLAYAVDLTEDTPALRRLFRLADRVRTRGRIVIREGDLAHWEDEIDRVYHLLSKALTHLPDYVPWQRSEVQALLEPFREVVDPELILFADVEGQTVGWFPGLANWNETIQHANGLRHPWDYVRLWWHARHQPACLTVKSVLVLPEYWDTGVSVLLFDEMIKRARAKGFKWLDLSLTSEENPYTPTLATRLGAKLYKRYRVYRLHLE